MSKRKNAAIGSAFDDFPMGEGTYEETQAPAIKRVPARQLERAHEEPEHHQGGHGPPHGNQQDPARDRVLDSDNDSLTLSVLARAVKVIGREIRLELV